MSEKIKNLPQDDMNLHINVDNLVDQFDKICRSCLCQVDEHCYLFQSEHDGNNIGDIYHILSTVQVESPDGLPNKLCEKCFEIVIHFKNFQKQALATEKILQAAILKKETELYTIPYTEFIDHSESPHLEHDIKIKQESKEIMDETDSDNSFRKVRVKRIYKRRRVKQKLSSIDQTCKICSRKIKKFRMPDHMRSHTKEKPFTCDLCGARFGQKGNLNRHCKTHGNEKPHSCEICGKAFLRASALTLHLNTAHTDEKQFICSTCGKAFKHQYYLKDHMKSHDSEGGNYPCVLCNKLYSTKATLKVHLLTHEGKTFLCSKCGKTFASLAILIGHRKIHSGKKPYECELCHKKFVFPCGLKMHKLIHSGEKPLVCSLCNKQFRQHGHLTTHMKSQHSGERPFICTFCDKSFKQRSNLIVHTRIHTGETPYICDICEKGFYDSSSMKKHRRGHENVRDEDMV